MVSFQEQQVHHPDTSDDHHRGERLFVMVLARRVADVAAGIATASGRFNESTYLRLFDPPTVLDHPDVASRAGAVRLDAALDPAWMRARPL